MAIPSDSDRGSWSLTGCAPFSQQVPVFLNTPTGSFFFVSTLITGQPFKKNVSRRAAIYSNCSFLSGDVTCAIDFRLVFKKIPFLSSDVKQYQIIKMQNNKKNLKETIQKRLSVLSFLIAIIPLFFIIRATLFLAQFSPPFFNLSQIRGDP